MTARDAEGDLSHGRKHAAQVREEKKQQPRWFDRHHFKLTLGFLALLFMIFDCPPSLSLLPVNALVAADAYIVPVVPEYLALEGLVNLLAAIDRLREGIDNEVFGNEIRVNVRLAEAPSFGKSIFEYAASAPGALAYEALALEVLGRCEELRGAQRKATA